MSNEERQKSFIAPGKRLMFDAGLNGGENEEVKEKTPKVSLESEIEKLLGYKPDESVVKRIKAIMAEKKLKKVEDAMLFYND